MDDSGGKVRGLGWLGGFVMEPRSDHPVGRPNSCPSTTVAGIHELLYTHLVVSVLIRMFTKLLRLA